MLGWRWSAAEVHGVSAIHKYSKLVLVPQLSAENWLTVHLEHAAAGKPLKTAMVVVGTSVVGAAVGASVVGAAVVTSGAPSPSPWFSP